MRKTSNPLPCIVYKATNLLNGKIYIGITTRPLRTRAREHVLASAKSGEGHFYRALRYHGAEYFHFSSIVRCATAIEAKEHEMRLIALWRPEYNSTMGGDGQLGRKLSEDAKRRIGNTWRGKIGPMAGRRHSEQARELLRAHGHANKDLWRQFAHMGPAAMARPVLCLDDGERFPSASAASRHYGIQKSSIIELCLGSNRYRRTAGGRRFAYVEAA